MGFVSNATPVFERIEKWPDTELGTIGVDNDCCSTGRTKWSRAVTGTAVFSSLIPANSPNVHSANSVIVFIKLVDRLNFVITDMPLIFAAELREI